MATDAQRNAALQQYLDAGYALFSLIDTSGSAPVQLPQTIGAFIVSSNSIELGNSVILTWGTSNASAVFLNGSAVAPAGSITASPALTTTYTLLARGVSPDVTVSRTVTVTTATLAQTINSFTVTPQSLPAGGGSATVTWSTSNATSVTLNGTPVVLSGSLSTTLTATTTYTLIAKGAVSDISASHTITVAPVVVAPPTDGTNVALASNGGVASASSSYLYLPFYTPASLNDGNRSGSVRNVDTGQTGSAQFRWLPNVWQNDVDATGPLWAQVQFTAADIVSVVVYSQQTLYLAPIEPYSDTTTTRGMPEFQVQTWNGTSFVTQAQVTGNTLARRVVTFASPVHTDRIRVVLTNVPGNRAALTEIEAWTAAAPVVTATPAAALGRFHIGATNYDTLAAAFAGITDGQTLTIDPGDYRTDCGTCSANNITIRSVSGEAVFYSSANGQGALNLLGRNVTVQGLVGVGIVNDSSNGSLIRFHGDTITINSCRGDLCEMGVLTGDDYPESVITINDWVGTRSEGRGGGLGHGLYIGYARKAYVNRANISGTFIGNLIKSRANWLVVTDCILPEGPGSVAIDAALGGILEVHGSTTITQTNQTDNLYIINYGAECSRLSDAVTRVPTFDTNIVWVDEDVVVTDTKTPPTGFVVHQFLVPTQFVDNSTYNGVQNIVSDPTLPSTPSPTPHNVASFVRTDTTTQGNWSGVYGSQGYVIIGGTPTDYFNGTHFTIPGDTRSLPAYVDKCSLSGGIFTWDETPTDVRALARAVSGRIASARVGTSYDDIDLRLNDDTNHQVSIYFLDWDSTSRAATVQVLDPNGNVLTAASVAYFFGGKFLVFTIKGTVKIRIISTSINAVYSGIFFDAAALPPPTGTDIATLSASLSPGQWGDLVSSNINVALRDPDSQNTKLRMHYCNSAPWNPVAEEIDFLGMDHGGASVTVGDVPGVPGALPALCRYHADTNTWDNILSNIGSHGYQFTTASPAGEIFRLNCGGQLPQYAWTGPEGLYKWNGSAFVFFCAGPEGLSQVIAHHPIVYWPGRGVFCFSGNTGGLYLQNMTTKVWTQVGQVTSSGVYHCVSAYSAAHDCIVFGGGNDNGTGNAVKLWRIDSAMTVTPMPNAPYAIGIYNGANWNSGPDGNFYSLGFGRHDKLDPTGSGSWSALATPPAGQLFANDHDAVFSSNTPFGIVYVGGRAPNGILDCEMRLFKT